MEPAFLWETKDKQIHDCDNCQKENVRQAKEVESDGRRGAGTILDKVHRGGILRWHLSRDHSCSYLGEEDTLLSG